ncbi:hypothetical protein BH09ACT4_BH09ACT4_13010 [soil metagenome]
MTTEMTTMTDAPRPAGWMAVAIAAPTAAFLFAGTAVWANIHDPLAEQRAAQAAVNNQAATGFPTDATVAAQDRVFALQQQLADLNVTIQEVNNKTRKVKGSTPVVVWRPSVVHSGSSSPPASSGGTGGSK